MTEITVIVPLKVDTLHFLKVLSDHYRVLFKHQQSICPLEVIIVEDCPHHISAILHTLFEGTCVQVIRLANEYRDGRNAKANAICFGVNRATYTKIIAADDDCLPTIEFLSQIAALLDNYDFITGMPCYARPNLLDAINLCGIYIINLLSEDKQLWGFIAFQKNLITKHGYANRNHLFDDLAMLRHFRKFGAKILYCPQPQMPMNSQTELKKFFLQRIRYAYENMAYPFRFAIFLSIMPILIGLSLISLKGATAVVLIISSVMLILGFLGQQVYRGNKGNRWVFLLSPMWFWWYPILSWISLAIYHFGGIEFGGRRIKQP